MRLRSVILPVPLSGTSGLDRKARREIPAVHKDLKLALSHDIGVRFISDVLWGQCLREINAKKSLLPTIC